MRVLPTWYFYSASPSNNKKYTSSERVRSTGRGQRNHAGNNSRQQNESSNRNGKKKRKEKKKKAKKTELKKIWKKEKKKQIWNSLAAVERVDDECAG